MKIKKRISLAFIATMITLLCFMGSILSPYAHAEEFIDDSVATSDAQTTEEKEEKSFWDSFLGFLGVDSTPNIVFKLEVANKKINSGDTIQVKKGDSITVKAYLKDYKNADESVGSLSVEYPQSETGKYSITNETRILSGSEIAATNESTNMFVYCPINDTSTSALETDPCPVIPKGTKADTDLFSFKVNVDPNISVNNFSITLKNITMGDENDDFIESDNSVVYDCGAEDTVTVNFEVINNSVNIPVTGVELNQDVIYPVVGQNPVQLTAKVIPENATNPTVNWSSENPNIATVTNGSVAAGSDKYGTTTITATTADWDKTDTCTANVSFVNLTGVSISLNESLDINFITNLTFPNNIDISKVALKCWRKDNPDNQDIIKSSKTTTVDGEEYRFQYNNIVSYEMGDIVYYQFVIDANGDNTFETTLGKVKEYSVYQYCTTALDYYDIAELKALLKSTLNYGAAAQNYFNYKEDNFVNCNLSSEDKVIPLVTVSDLESFKAKSTPNLSDNLFTCTSAQLLLDSKIKLRLCYAPTTENTMTKNDILGLKLKYKISTDTEYQTMGLTYSNDLGYYVEIPIDAPSLVNMYDFYLSNGNGEGQLCNLLEYGAFSYCRTVLNTSGFSEELKQLCMAIVDYGRKADAYFNKSN